MTETILDERAVSEIEGRPARVNTRFEEMIILTLAERDALCATVKHLRERLAMCEGEITAADPGKWGHESKIHLLQSQLEQLRSELSEAQSLIKMAQTLETGLRTENEGLKLSKDELRVLTDYHYYEAEKAITRRGDSASQHQHLERLATLRGTLDQVKPGEM